MSFGGYGYGAASGLQQAMQNRSSIKGGSSMAGNKGYRGATGGVSDLKGTGYKQFAMPQFTKEQLNLFKSLFSQTGAGSQLGQLAGGNQEAFGQLEQPALQQFGALQGNLASRFSGFGGLGGRQSSGFQNTLNSAAQDFASQLQSQRLGIQRQAQQDLLGLSQGLLGQRPFEDTFIPKQQKQPGFWSNLFSGLTGSASNAAGSLGTIYGANKLGLFGGRQNG